MKLFRLYRHIRPDTDEVFYIGIGNYKRSTEFKKGRNKHWKNVYDLNNKSIIVEELLTDMTWEQACEKEKWWIALYGRRDKGKGTLVNMTDGGEGGYGRMKTSETIKKFRETMSTKVHPMKGKTHTAEARAKIAEGAHNKIWTQEAIDKVREKNKLWERTPEMVERRISKIRGVKWSQERKDSFKEKINQHPKWIASAELRAHISARLMGHTVSEESRRKMSESQKGKKQSAETIEKRRKVATGKNIKGKKVINTLTGEVYISAAIALKLSGQSFNSFYRRLSGKVVDNTFVYRYI